MSHGKILVLEGPLEFISVTAKFGLELQKPSGIPLDDELDFFI